jgi:hypothetical protein
MCCIYNAFDRVFVLLYIVSIFLLTAAGFVC